MITVLDDARFINLLSFKRDGSGVETPVWAATLHGKLVIYTNGDSYKVKRIQRNPSVQVARCDVRGKLLGPWHDAVCAFATDEAKKKGDHQSASKKVRLAIPGALLLRHTRRPSKKLRIPRSVARLA